MQGILVVDKPAGFTSFDVVAKLRGILQTRRIGHSGTLDPMATGVLPIFVGGASKAVDLQPRHDKTYMATVRFGLQTDTGDITGAVVNRCDNVQLDRQQLQRVLADFCGPLEQLPPMYSAVKVNGKPLYRYAREGQQVERKLRRVVVHSIDLEDVQTDACILRVHCSKGTYIRTLAEDIGAALGLPATLAALRRTQAGLFGEAQAHTLDAVQAARDEGRLEALFLGTDTVFAALPKLELDPATEKRLRNGAPVYGVRGEAGDYRAYGAGDFLGLAQLRPTGELRVKKLFLG